MQCLPYAPSLSCLILSVRDGSGLAQIVALVVRGCWYSGPALPLPIRSWVWLSGGLPLLLIMAFLAIYIAPSLGGLSSACPLAYLILPLVQFNFWFSRAPRSTAGQPSAAGTHFGRSSFSRSFRPLRRLPPLFGSSVNWPHLSAAPLIDLLLQYWSPPMSQEQVQSL